MSRPFRIKVCGVGSAEVARAAIEAGADHLGLIFCASIRRITPERAADLVARVPAAWVGVFADAPLREIADLTAALGLAATQLHGRELPATCEAVRRATGVPVWKALGPDLAGSETEYEDAADALLLDSGAGGSGRRLDWEAVGRRFPRSRRTVPVLLAGGLDSTNVATAIALADPDGVDASSRLETTPGVKDLTRVRAFVGRARAAAATHRDPTGATP